MNQYHRTRNHSRSGPGLKWSLSLLAVAACVAEVRAQPADPKLRSTLSALLAEGRIDEAVKQAQAALEARPNDAGVRREFLSLHMSLARDWLRRRKFSDCEAALAAVLALDAGHQAASTMLAQIRASRARADQQPPEIDRLLKLELFEAALDLVQQVKALRPETDGALASRERAAWLGAADDHYLARNFNEALALYENLIALDPKSPNDLRRRWGISLALAVSESEDERFAQQELTGRILARTAEVLESVGDPSIERLIRGLLAETSGQLVEAGRLLSAALGETWELPSADRRRAVVSNLHNRAVKKLHELYEATPTRRRAAAWSVALPNVWKHRPTPHFDVHTRSDLVSEYVAEAIEYHLNGIAKWLGVELDHGWTPRCEIRVYARLDAFHAATETSGVTRAVSLTRIQGQRVLARKISVFQSDPWLLSGTLPHELTHILLAERLRAASDRGPTIVPPFALDEGLAVQAEPAARRLRYRRLLVSRAPNPLNLMKVSQIIGDHASFYARSGALAEFILQRKGMSGLLQVCRQVDTSWWESLDWPNKDVMLAEWKPWYAARRDPPRMPLIILTQPPDARKK